jgi:hypothetical protein
LLFLVVFLSSFFSFLSILCTRSARCNAHYLDSGIRYNDSITHQQLQA